jgi:hypothetical protein
VPVNDDSQSKCQFENKGHLEGYENFRVADYCWRLRHVSVGLNKVVIHLIGLSCQSFCVLEVTVNHGTNFHECLCGKPVHLIKHF